MIASDTDPHNLARFIAAQEPVIDRVRAELRAGRKSSHWMWFVFPQIAGLGRSEIARFYAIRSCEEAAAYLAHPMLGPRLVECTRLINAVKGSTAKQILGHVDAMKFHSCMTLFATVSLQTAINTYLAQRNAEPIRFVWIASAASILAKLARLPASSD